MIDPKSDFSWCAFYAELAKTLVGWKTRQPELVEFLVALRGKQYPVMPFQDTDPSGQEKAWKAVDPFTFLGIFNRGIADANRTEIAKEIAARFGMSHLAPQRFSGIPRLSNFRSYFLTYRNNPNLRNEVECLWHVFEAAQNLKENAPQDEIQNFKAAFDAAQSLHGVKINLTMGLFWSRPDIFVNLDARNRKYLAEKIPSLPKVKPSQLTGENYWKTSRAVKAWADGKAWNLPTVSHNAYCASETSPI